ncbi:MULTISPECIES: hypothetical protein [Paracoccus]|uniref:hypothetical protein n=1 Tax=Paracoccus TaxID=265 RepID=UPI002586FD2A|nr:hypothetical protein [Paracoccus sp. (in: a-proteobacteria)]
MDKLSRQKDKLSIEINILNSTDCGHGPRGRVVRQASMSGKGQGGADFATSFAGRVRIHFRGGE